MNRKKLKQKAYTKFSDWRSHRGNSVRIGGQDLWGGLSSVAVVSRDVVKSIASAVQESYQVGADKPDVDADKVD